MEQRTLRLGDRIVYCYEDGSVEFLSKAKKHKSHPLLRTFGTTGNKGYKLIRLYINGKRQSFKVHRLIATAFRPNPENKPHIDHVNRNRNDNRVTNLRWVTSKENSENRGDRVPNNEKRLDRYNEYNNSHAHLYAIRPDGKETRYSFSSTSDPIYIALKPLSMKDRYFKYIALKNNH